VIGPVGAAAARIIDMPFANQEGRPAGIAQDLRHGRGLAGQVAAIAGIAGVDIRQPAHAGRMGIEPREQRRPGRRTHGAGAEIGIAHARAGQGVEGRCPDLAAVTAQIGETDIIQDDRDDVRRALRGRRLSGIGRA